MKKITALMLCILSVFSLAACQPTPEVSIMEKKDSERLLEMAQATKQPDENIDEPAESAKISGEELLRQRLGIPKRLTETIHTDGDKLSVVIDADIQIPAEGNLPSARTQAVNFSQDCIDRLYKVLIGDTIMYHSTPEQSKSDIEKQILINEKELAAATTDDLKEHYESVIEELREAYKTAPDKVELIRGDSTLQTKNIAFDETDILNGEMSYVDLMESTYGGKSFDVQNNITYKNADAQADYSYVDEYGNTHSFAKESRARMTYSRNTENRRMLIENQGGYFYVDATDQSLTGEAVPESLLAITAKEARSIGEKFLEDLGFSDMTIDEVSLVCNFSKDVPDWQKLRYSDEESWKEDGSPRYQREEQHAWQITFRRTVNGVPIIADIDATSLDGTDMTASWTNEKFCISIDDEGLRDAYWIAPIEVTEIVTPDTSMLSFSEVKKIFENMMRIKYEYRARELEDSTEYHISRIRLSLQRISETDTFTTGLLVPVWNFYGDIAYNGEGFQKEDGWPFLTINGIDGSVIDIHKGY